MVNKLTTENQRRYSSMVHSGSCVSPSPVDIGKRQKSRVLGRDTKVEHDRKEHLDKPGRSPILPDGGKQIRAK
jgi:hypothetical protein